jgi:hypothetical protein
LDSLDEKLKNGNLKLARREKKEKDQQVSTSNHRFFFGGFQLQLY